MKLKDIPVGDRTIIIDRKEGNKPCIVLMHFLSKADKPMVKVMIDGRAKYSIFRGSRNVIADLN